MSVRPFNDATASFPCASVSMNTNAKFLFKSMRHTVPYWENSDSKSVTRVGGSKLPTKIARGRLRSSEVVAMVLFGSVSFSVPFGRLADGDGDGL